jgi:hypothetical protein
MYYCNYEKAKLLFIKLANAFQIRNIDIDEKVNFIRLNGIRELTRVSGGRFSTIPLITNNNNHTLTCCSANFRYENKLQDEIGQYSVYEKKIIHDEKSRVVWITNGYREPEFFLRIDNEFYGISGDHKRIRIYKNMGITELKVTVNQNYGNLDDIVKKYENEKNKCKEMAVDLSVYFPKGFFYKGPKWTRELYPNGIITYNKISLIDKLVKIEIENISYPHKGYVLLDLSNYYKIIEAKKIDN